MKFYDIEKCISVAQYANDCVMSVTIENKMLKIG